MGGGTGEGVGGVTGGGVISNSGAGVGSGNVGAGVTRTVGEGVGAAAGVGGKVTMIGADVGGLVTTGVTGEGVEGAGVVGDGVAGVTGADEGPGVGAVGILFKAGGRRTQVSNQHKCGDYVYQYIVSCTPEMKTYF